MEKMALFGGRTFHARQEGTARETTVGCGTVVQASATGRARGRDGRGGQREGFIFLHNYTKLLQATHTQHTVLHSLEESRQLLPAAV